MVETGDVVGGLLAGAVLADYLTIPYSAAALYLSLRGKSYWKLPYAVPIKALTKERIVQIPKITGNRSASNAQIAYYIKYRNCTSLSLSSDFDMMGFV